MGNLKSRLSWMVNIFYFTLVESNNNIKSELLFCIFFNLIFKNFIVFWSYVSLQRKFLKKNSFTWQLAFTPHEKSLRSQNSSGMMHQFIQMLNASATHMGNKGCGYYILRQPASERWWVTLRHLCQNLVEPQLRISSIKEVIKEQEI